MPKLTKEEIRERLQTDQVDILPTRTPFFEAVPERKIRYVVAIIVNGDGVASRTMDIEKLEEDGTTYTMKFEKVPVAPADVRTLPRESYDIEDPIVTCEGGTRLYGTASGNTLYATIEYWDSDI